MLYARPRSARDTDEFFRDRQYGELWVGRRPSLQRDLRLARPRVPPHRRARTDAPLDGAAQDPGAARGRRRRRPAGRGRRRAATRTSPRVASRAAADQGRLGGRASSRRRATSPRSASRTRSGEWDRRARVRRALGRGHLLPPGPGDGQRHRLRLDRRRRRARHHAALDRQHRPDRRPASWCCSTWASRAATSTPPTSPARCRSTAPSPPLQRELYDLVLRRPAGRASRRVRPGAAVPAPPTTPRWTCSPTGWSDLEPAAGLGRGGARPGVEGLRALDAARHQPHARHGRARLRPAPRRTSTPRATSPRAWC